LPDKRRKLNLILGSIKMTRCKKKIKMKKLVRKKIDKKKKEKKRKRTFSASNDE
jgi:hypothetical protein